MDHRVMPILRRQVKRAGARRGEAGVSHQALDHSRMTLLTREEQQVRIRRVRATGLLCEEPRCRAKESSIKKLDKRKTQWNAATDTRLTKTGMLVPIANCSRARTDSPSRKLMPAVTPFISQLIWNQWFETLSD